MRTIILGVGLGAALLSSGCANMTDTQQRTLSGAGLGAAAGTAIGALSGSAGWGAAIGAGTAGALRRASRAGDSPGRPDSRGRALRATGVAADCRKSAYPLIATGGI